MKYHFQFFNPMITGEDISESVIQLLLRKISQPIGIDVNMEKYLRSILGSSLNLKEKLEVLESIPSNNQFQVDSLQQVFADEYIELGQLTSKDWPYLCSVGANSWVISIMLADNYFGRQFLSSTAERSELSRMLQKKYQGANRRWAEEALSFDSAVVQHVYRNLGANFPISFD